MWLYSHFWVVSIVGAMIYFSNPRISFWYINIIAILCLATSVLSYTKIFLILRHNQIHALGPLFQGQPSQAISMSITRHRKAVSSALWVQTVLAVCYLPYCIIVFSTPQGGFPLSFYLARQYAYTLIYVNSSIKPVAVLLEDQRNQRSSQGCTKTVIRSALARCLSN